MTDGTSSQGVEQRQGSPRLGVDENPLREGWSVWYVDGFGIEQSDKRAKQAIEAGEEVHIVYGR